MNKIYRLKFSKRLNALVAVSELTRGCDHSTEKGSEKPARMKVRHLALKPLSAILLSLGVTSIPQSVLASGLQGMDVVHGTATMQVDGNKTIIRNSVDAIINWKQFNIDQNEMVQFLQENNNSAVFNRVTSNQISQLKGILDSNGQVFLINPNGITIGKDAIINTNGFTASTLDISNENIKARNFTLEQTKDKALAEIVNHGLITVGKDGSVNLIGGKVKNEGVISVNGGSISLLAGQKITISDIINPTITYSIAAPENEAVNLGDIFAKGGNINVRAANIRNQGKLSADSVSKDKSGNIILSAKEGEAEIGGVISAQNQQAKGGKLMITGDKVTLKTGAVIDLSGKEGGETYLGGDERGEGKNGIQLAKKTSLEKGSTINVSGKEKGGRAIVWGDIALIDGNINAQGSDIAETGGFVETSGHYLSIDDNVIVKTKEWLLDPDNVEIKALDNSRQGTDIDSEFPIGDGSAKNPKKNNDTKTILTNETITTFLQRANVMNITAKKKLTVNSSINIGSNSHLILHSEGQSSGGVQIDGDITSNGGNLTINSGGWVNVHKNITLGTGFLNITSKGSVAFEKAGNNKGRAASDATITAQGTITFKNQNELRLNNVSINGTGKGLSFIANQNNFTHKLEGEINISGTVTINQTTHANAKYWCTSKDSFWNVTRLNLERNANFTFIKFVSGNSVGPTTAARSSAGVIFNSGNKEMNFNVAQGAKVNFKLKSNENTNKSKPLPHQFKSNITVNGQGSVFFDVYANHSGRGIDFNMSSINVSGGANLTFNSHIRGDSAFKISKDLTINASGSQFNLEQTLDSFSGDKFPQNAISSTHNITILKGNVTLGGRDSSSSITGTVSIASEANVTLQAKNGYGNNKKLTLGNVLVDGKLNLTGASVDINGNLTVNSTATFNGKTDDNLNITGTFANNGASIIDVKKGAAKLGNITNEGNLNITTNASGTQKTIINGNITNKKGSLNITDNKANAEIQIGGNISQKEGNLTISSDKINITKQITIKAGVNGENSESDAESNANLTIKTKELKLVEDLNISGFNKAEITAKNGNDLTIGEASSSGDSDAKKVTFNKVKDSKISAGDHNVTLNSKVETSNGDSGVENGSNNNNAGLTVTAKNVTVNNNITSHKAVNITASEKVATKEGTTINATTGNVKVNTKTGDIKGKVESTSGSVTLSATGETLTVSSISGNAVTITADSGKLTSTADSKIEAKSGEANVTSATGTIGGTISGNTVNVATTGGLTTQAGSKIEAKSGEANVTSATGTIDGTISGKTVSVTATTDSLTVKGGAKINATEGAATLTATKGTLTTQASSSITSNNGQTTLTAKDSSIAGSINAANVTLNTTGTLTTVKGSNINAASGTLVINAKDAKLNGAASGDHTVVNATNASGSGSVTAKTSSNVNITGDLSTVNGLNIISKNGKNTVVLKGAEIDVKYIQPGVASANEVIEAKRVLEKVKDLSDEERETLAKLGVSAVRFVEPNNTITVNTQNEFTTRPSSQVIISEGKACFSSGNGAAVCTNVADDGQQ
ncbi:filamentous hemagglutinin N-terminal domain-containing protein [Haemophilus influenzae]|uniref:two-partner secretion domain-containing protein n=1 Tax=Haemophilus influenzae TaxID=727 RepID=UPI003DA0D864